MTKGIKAGTKVVVKFPETIAVKLVPANELKTYEIFEAFTGLFLSVAASFWTAFFTTAEGKQALFFSAVCFSLSTLVFFCLALVYRRKVYSREIEVAADLQEDFR